MIGHLKINPNFTLQVDYEKYEVIYLSISVTDRNQVVNNDTAFGEHNFFFLLFNGSVNSHYLNNFVCFEILSLN